MSIMHKANHLMQVHLPPIAPFLLETLTPTQLALLQASRQRAVTTPQATMIKGIGPGPAIRPEEIAL